MHRSARILARRAVRETVHHSQRRNVSLALPQCFHFDSQEGDGNTNDKDVHRRARTTDERPSRHSLSSDFFESTRNENFRPQGTPDGVVRRFRKAVEERNIAALHVTYTALREEAINSSTPSYAQSHIQAQDFSSITAKDLKSAMIIALGNQIRYTPRSLRSEKGRQQRDRIALGSASVQDGRLVQQIFEDLEAIFGFKVGAAEYELSLRCLAVQRLPPSVIFEHYVKIQRHLDSEMNRGLTTVIGECSKRGDIETVRKVWHHIESENLSIDGRNRDLLIHVLLKDGDVESAMTIAYGKDATEESIISFFNSGPQIDLAWYLEGLCRAGDGLSLQSSKIASILRNRPKALGLYEWHALLLYAAFTEGGAAAVKIIKEGVEARSVQPDEKTFNILLLCHARELREISQGGTEEDVARLFERLQENCLVRPDKYSFSIGISTLLGKPPSLLYKGTFRGGVNPQKRYQEAIYSIPFHLEPILSAHLAEVNSVTEHEQILSALGSEYNARKGEAGLKNVREIPRYTPGQIYEAMLLYERFRSKDLQPDNAIIYSLLDAHANAYVPDHKKIVSLYKDLRKSISRRKAEEGVGQVSRQVYDVLLYALAKVRDLKLANKIIQDMVKDGISLSQSNQSNLAVLMMQASQSHEAAFHIYTQFRDRGISSKLSDESTQRVAPFDRHGWLRIINCFSKLDFIEDSTLAPIEQVLEMVKDMRQYRYDVDTILYTTLLHYFGRRATKSDEKDIYRASVLKIHSFLQHQSNLEPDLILVTALMDAYNRVELSAQALEIWNRLVLQSTLVDSACIAVILDTCGRSGRLKEARRAWNWIRRNKLQRNQCNKGVWDAYVECLFRCGQTREAIEVVFGEMKSELSHKGDNEVDAKTMGMVLRFASARSQRWTIGSNEEFPLLAEVKERMQKEIPQVWDQVKLIHIPLD